MNDMYSYSLKASREGGKRFVIYKSLKEMGVDEESIYKYLKDGYDIRTVCINGDMHNTWKVDDAKIINSFEHVLEMKLDCKFLFVKTQEFFTDICVSEGKKMWIELWKDDKKPETIILHEKDEITQKKIETILNLIFIRGLKQYTDDILKLYEKRFTIKE